MVAWPTLICTLCVSNHPRITCVIILCFPTPLHSFHTYQHSNLFVSSWMCRWMIPFCSCWLKLHDLSLCVWILTVHLSTVVLLRIVICVTRCVFSVLRWLNFFVPDWTSYGDDSRSCHKDLSFSEFWVQGSWRRAHCLGVNKLNDLQQNFSNQDNRWTKRLRQQITLLIPLSPAFLIAALTPSPAAASPLLFKPEGGLLLITIYHYLRNS